MLINTSHPGAFAVLPTLKETVRSRSILNMYGTSTFYRAFWLLAHEIRYTTQPFTPAMIYAIRRDIYAS